MILLTDEAVLYLLLFYQDIRVETNNDKFFFKYIAVIKLIKLKMNLMPEKVYHAHCETCIKVLFEIVLLQVNASGISA